MLTTMPAKRLEMYHVHAQLPVIRSSGYQLSLELMSLHHDDMVGSGFLITYGSDELAVCGGDLEIPLTGQWADKSYSNLGDRGGQPGSGIALPDGLLLRGIVCNWRLRLKVNTSANGIGGTSQYTGNTGTIQLALTAVGIKNLANCTYAYIRATATKHLGKTHGFLTQKQINKLISSHFIHCMDLKLNVCGVACDD
ncbi:unnamed protein product [Protopolystoma xenopodis]|uniref:Uncharacterized protein n=1 Tax=Protopolystoma xenopodis TaxID=117903 RepID=A0A448XBM9_9PLAT|nr:unnamed protein product [Protopolystoma xenopodis]